MTGLRSGKRRGPSHPIRVAILVEQVLGHRVFAQNLRPELTAYGDLQTEWVDIRFDPGELRHLAVWLGRHRALWGSLQAVQALLGLRTLPDVLLFHTQTIAQLALPLMRVVPTIISLDSTQRQFGALAAAYGARSPGHTPLDRLVQHINGAVFRAAWALLPWSTWTAASLRSDYLVHPSRIVVNPPGVHLPPVSGLGRRDDDGPLRILFVGGDFERKGGRLLLDVLRTIRLPWELHIVTGEPVGGDDRVRVHGPLDNASAALAALFASSDLFALPTLGDCFSISSIEAMAAGLPVVTTTVGGIPDIVVDGETGFLVPPGDRELLRRRLELLLTNGELRRRLGEAGRRRAEACFAARDRAATVYQLIRAVHGKGRGGRA